MNSFPYKLGLKRSKKDSRDYKYSSPLRNHKILPTEYELPIIRAIYNQQTLNSCASHAVSQQILALEDYTKSVYPSRLFLYYNARTVAGDEDEDEGTTYRDMYKGLFNFGFCDEKMWKYDPNNVLVKPSSECYATADKDLVKKYKSLVNSLYSIKYALCENLPVAIGLVLYENFEPDDMGVIQMPKGKIEGSHAVVIVGYSDHTRLFKILNSWGPSWVLDGFAYVPYDYVLNPDLCHDLWIVTK